MASTSSPTPTGRPRPLPEPPQGRRRHHPERERPGRRGHRQVQQLGLRARRRRPACPGGRGPQPSRRQDPERWQRQGRGGAPDRRRAGRRQGRLRAAGRVPDQEPFADKQWDMRMIDATPSGSYRVDQGRRGVLVGSIDSGIDGNHPDLRDNFNRRNLGSGIALPPHQGEGGPWHTPMRHWFVEVMRRSTPAMWRPSNRSSPTRRSGMSRATAPSRATTRAWTRCSASSGPRPRVPAEPSGPACTTWWPTTTTSSGCTARTPNATGAPRAAQRCWCSMFVMAGSPRPGRTTTTSTSSTSSGPSSSPKNNNDDAPHLAATAPSLAQRVRAVLGDHCLVGKSRRARGNRVADSNCGPPPEVAPGGRGCGCLTPAVSGSTGTARCALREPVVLVDVSRGRKATSDRRRS